MSDHAPQRRSPRATTLAVAAIVVGGAVAAIGWRQAQDEWFYAYLTAWLYWGGLSLGSVAILLLHNLTGGAWGVAARPALRAAASTTPLAALLFVPIAVEAVHIYPWADAYHADDPVLQHKRAYLNVPFFQARAGAYFAIWLLLVALLAWQSRRLIAPQSLAERRLRRFSGQGLALHGLAVTFASVDWMMSLEPHWFSTIYGVIVFAGEGLSALALAIFVTASGMAGHDAANDEAGVNALHDLGKLLLAFLMFWAYVSFSQFLIIWYGNLAEEVVWYIVRFHGIWGVAALAIVILHFAVPFVLLLGREIKRRPRQLAAIALLILAMHWVHLLWQVRPAIPSEDGYHLWLDVGLWLAIGGVWCLLFAYRYPRFVLESTREGGRHG